LVDWSSLLIPGYGQKDHKERNYYGRQI
jgi:hypothetical protein